MYRDAYLKHKSEAKSFSSRAHRRMLDLESRLESLIQCCIVGSMLHVSMSEAM